jgi:hypothetical protein
LAAQRPLLLGILLLLLGRIEQERRLLSAMLGPGPALSWW